MATKRIYNMGTRATEFSKLIQSMTGKHQLWEMLMISTSAISGTGCTARELRKAR